MYSAIVDMPLETAEVLLFCLRSEQAAEGSGDELAQFQQATDELWIQMGILSPK
jgi:hypothetical protein